MDIETLKDKRRQLSQEMSLSVHKLERVSNESLRVADVAHRSSAIIDKLEFEFETATGLNKTDTAVLFFAIALQIARIHLVSYFTRIEKAGNKNSKEQFLKNTQNKIFDKISQFGDTEALSNKYYSSFDQIISTPGVPYDITKYKDVNYGLFNDANHRFSTLGHDPVWGLIFGTANILTNTITCSDMLLTTNHIEYEDLYKHPRIGVPGSILEVFYHSSNRFEEDKLSVVAALIKQIIHIGTDMYTPCGIQIPSANLVLSKENVEKVTRIVSAGDILKVCVSAKMCNYINILISTLHTITLDLNCPLSEVKTRKIILLSNAIATSSNVVWVVANAIWGDKKQVKNLDVGGIIELTRRLTTDIDIILKIKEEFVLGGFKRLILDDRMMEENEEMEKTLWE